MMPVIVFGVVPDPVVAYFQGPADAGLVWMPQVVALSNTRLAVHPKPGPGHDHPAT